MSSINNISVGSYIFNQEVKCIEIDEDTSNNIFSFPLEIGITGTGCLGVITHLSRETRTNTSISPSDYTGSIGGDEIGYEFMLNNDGKINSVTIKISDNTDAGTTIRAKLNKWDGNTWQLVESSDDYDIEQSDIGNKNGYAIARDLQA